MAQADCTGRLLPPRKRAIVIAQLSNGSTITDAARKAKCSRNLAMVVRDQHFNELQRAKELLAHQCQQQASEALDQMAEQLRKRNLSANQLVPVFGVLVDKTIALRPELAPPPQEFTVAHHHLHEFVQRNIKQATASEVFNALPDQ